MQPEQKDGKAETDPRGDQVQPSRSDKEVEVDTVFPEKKQMGQEKRETVCS